MWKVPSIWQECFIIGGGSSIIEQFDIPAEVAANVLSKKASASVYSEYMKELNNKKVIGVNTAYLFDCVDVCYFADKSFYKQHHYGLKEFKKLKITSNSAIKQHDIKNLKQLTYRYGIDDNPRMLAWNKNSGAAAINLAVHLGAKKIYLLGFDMKVNEVTHWHSLYDRKTKREQQEVFNRHLKGFRQIAIDSKERGIEIINLNKPHLTSIKDFPIKMLKDVI